MNPETRQLELMQQDASQLAEVMGPPRRLTGNTSADVQALQVDLERLMAKQQSEPHKLGWTTFTVGELVEVEGGFSATTQQLKVQNIHAPGLLLRGRGLATEFEAGMALRVKGERCEVVRVSSKGLYVKGV